MPTHRHTPDELRSILRVATSRQGGTGTTSEAALPFAVVDLRSASAFRRSHLVGSVSIPSRLLADRLFLLPGRSRPLLLAAADGSAAREGAEFLAGKGWAEVRWLDGSPMDLPSGARRSGAEPHRLWEPAPLLAEWLDRLPRDGLCCDLACGSGREVAALALGGRDVLGVDVLPDALRQARHLARMSRVPGPGRASFRLLDLRDPALARALLRPGRFRIVTCFRYLDRRLLPLLRDAIAPGGFLVFETFLRRQAEIGRKPRKPSRLLEPGELRERFSDLEVMTYREGPNREGDWLASLVARRS